MVCFVFVCLRFTGVVVFVVAYYSFWLFSFADSCCLLFGVLFAAVCVLCFNSVV